MSFDATASSFIISMPRTPYVASLAGSARYERTANKRRVKYLHGAGAEDPGVPRNWRTRSLRARCHARAYPHPCLCDALWIYPAPLGTSVGCGSSQYRDPFNDALWIAS